MINKEILEKTERILSECQEKYLELKQEQLYNNKCFVTLICPKCGSFCNREFHKEYLFLFIYCKEEVNICKNCGGEFKFDYSSDIFLKQAVGLDIHSLLN